MPIASALYHDGQAIALLPENAEKLARAVEQLRRKPASQPTSHPAADRVAGIERRLVQLSAEISDLARIEPPSETHTRVGSVLMAASERLQRLALEFGPVA